MRPGILLATVYDDVPSSYTGWLVLSIALDVALLCSLLTVLVGSGILYLTV